jgi:hypothetical protein
MGGMTERGLRREADKGRLKLYRINGRDFTTLADIAKMTEACTRPPKAKAPQVQQVDTALAMDAALAALDRL